MTLHEDLINRLRLNLGNTNNMIYLPYHIMRDMQEAADVIEEMDAEYASMAAALLEADELIRKLQRKYDDLGRKEREPGTWKLAFTEEENIYECSACGKYWLLNDGDPYENEMNFCPKCGKPMYTRIEGAQTIPVSEPHGRLIDADEARSRWLAGEEDVLFNAPTVMSESEEE